MPRQSLHDRPRGNNTARHDNHHFVGMDPVGRVRNGSRNIDVDPVVAQAIQCRNQFRRHSVNEDDQLPDTAGPRDARLILEQGLPCDRKQGSKPVGIPAVFAIGQDQACQWQVNASLIPSSLWPIGSLRTFGKGQSTTERTIAAPHGPTNANWHFPSDG
jgi:hypothetical protein